MPRPPKQQALHAIERLPDDVPLDGIAYRFYVLSKVQQGLDEIAKDSPTSAWSS